MKLEKLTDMFLRFEDENNMFDKQINNVHYWQYIRFLVETSLFKYFGLNSAYPGYEYKNEHKYNMLERIQVNIKKNTKLWEKRDVLIIPHERKYKWKNGKSRCIYTDAIDQNLKRSHYILDSKCVEGYYAKQRSKNVIFQDIETQFSYVQRGKVIYTKLIFEKEVLNPIEDFFQIKISIEDKNKWISSINSYLNIRPKYENYYKHVLDIICPKAIIITVGYSFNRIILCEVAQQKKIPVIELQHGQIAKTHIAYNYLHSYQNMTFPDYFFCYGKFEREEVRFPIDKNKIIPVGFPELERVSKERKRKDNKIKIMFISQLNPVIAEYAKALDEMLEPESYEIIFKLHPKEYDNWRQRYGDIFQYTKIKVIGNFKETIHEQLKEVDWVIGIYSTVLLEATMFDVNIAVLKEGLYESIPYLYKNGYAILVESPIKLVSIIKNRKNKLRKKENNIFFEKDSTKNMIREIEMILANNNREKEC